MAPQTENHFRIIINVYWTPAYMLYFSSNLTVKEAPEYFQLLMDLYYHFGTFVSQNLIELSKWLTFASFHTVCLKKLGVISLLKGFTAKLGEKVLILLLQ